MVMAGNVKTFSLTDSEKLILSNFLRKIKTNKRKYASAFSYHIKQESPKKKRKTNLEIRLAQAIYEPLTPPTLLTEIRRPVVKPLDFIGLPKDF
jgi:hypothetical protein